MFCFISSLFWKSSFCLEYVTLVARENGLGTLICKWHHSCTLIILLFRSIHMAKNNVNLLRNCIPPIGKTLGQVKEQWKRIQHSLQGGEKWIIQDNGKSTAITNTVFNLYGAYICSVCWNTQIYVLVLIPNAIINTDTSHWFSWKFWPRKILAYWQNI